MSQVIWNLCFADINWPWYPYNSPYDFWSKWSGKFMVTGAWGEKYLSARRDLVCAQKYVHIDKNKALPSASGTNRFSGYQCDRKYLAINRYIRVWNKRSAISEYLIFIVALDYGVPRRLSVFFNDRRLSVYITIAILVFLCSSLFYM